MTKHLLSQGHYLISVHTLAYQMLPFFAYFCRDIINLIFKPEKGQKLTLYFQVLNFTDT